MLEMTVGATTSLLPFHPSVTFLSFPLPSRSAFILSFFPSISFVSFPTPFLPLGLYIPIVHIMFFSAVAKIRQISNGYGGVVPRSFRSWRGGPIASVAFVASTPIWSSCIMTIEYTSLLC